MFQEFNKLSSKEWKLKIQADLKGVDYQSLISQTPEHIDIKPFYHADDYIAVKHLVQNNFAIAQELKIANENIAQKIAKKALDQGADIFTFQFDNTFDIDKLIHHLDYDKLIFKADLLDIDFLLELFEKTAGKSSILIDPIGHFARYGNWFENQEKDFNKIRLLQQKLPDNYIFISIRTNVYKDAGAIITQELAYALGHAVEYAENFGKEILQQMQVDFAIGNHYFFEIAKIKTFKLLWESIVSDYKVQNNLRIYAQPGIRNKTIFDPYVNMLRSTMEMMSAIIGGADIIANFPYDKHFKKTNSFSERIARNQLIILKNEAHYNEALNSTEGNYYIENISYQLAEKSLDIFKLIEKSGGFLSQLYKGKIQEKIAKNATKEQASFDEGKQVLVGTNKYINEKEQVEKIDIYPFMKKRKGQTLVPPIVPKRLAEKLEEKRLRNMGIKF